jgi:hypothetical protein
MQGPLDSKGDPCVGTLVWPVDHGNPALSVVAMYDERYGRAVSGVYKCHHHLAVTGSCPVMRALTIRSCVARVLQIERPQEPQPCGGKAPLQPMQ